MKNIKNKIKRCYVPGKTSLREVARKLGIDHHQVKKALDCLGIPVVKAKVIMSKSHRVNISKACKGRKSWSKGKKMPKCSLYKNMAAHLRFSVTEKWLSQFVDIEKLKLLNNCITNRSGRFNVSTRWYKDYIVRFYYDKRFNNIYLKWLKSGKEKYLKPSIDHIIPRSNGGGNEIKNIQFLTWFENRCKSDMTISEWNLIKGNIKNYFYV